MEGIMVLASTISLLKQKFNGKVDKEVESLLQRVQDFVPMVHNLRQSKAFADDHPASRKLKTFVELLVEIQAFVTEYLERDKQNSYFVNMTKALIRNGARKEIEARINYYNEKLTLARLVQSCEPQYIPCHQVNCHSDDLNSTDIRQMVQGIAYDVSDLKGMTKADIVLTEKVLDKVSSLSERIEEMQQQQDEHYRIENEHYLSIMKITESFKHDAPDSTLSLQEQMKDLSIMVSNMYNATTCSGVFDGQTMEDIKTSFESYNQLLNQQTIVVGNDATLAMKVEELSKQMNASESRLMQTLQSQTAMIRSLLDNTSSVPYKFIVIPAAKNDNKSIWESMKSVVKLKYRLFFVCEYTGELSLSGEDGRGYIIWVTKEWLKQAAPFIKLGFLALKIGAGFVSSGLKDLLNEAQAILPSDLKIEQYLEVLEQHVMEDLQSNGDFVDRGFIGSGLVTNERALNDDFVALSSDKRQAAYHAMLQFLADHDKNMNHLGVR
jgi:hypothetical protein